MTNTTHQCPVTEADRNCLKAMLLPSNHEAVDRGDYDSHDDLQAIARHRVSAVTDLAACAAALHEAGLLNHADYHRTIDRIQARARVREIMA